MKKKEQAKKKRTLWIVIGSILILLVIIRILLPYILLKAVNKELTKIPGYTGHVEDIDVALIRGAYKIKEIKLEKTGGKIPVPFFEAEVIDLSIQWHALFQGALVGKIIVEHPKLNFVKGPTEETSQTHIDKKWTDVIGDLMPLKLNRFEIEDGEIHYRDFYSSPKVDIFTKNVHIIAENLTNAKKNKELLPSTADGTADIYGGHARLTMKLDALNHVPTFEAKAELVSMNIVDLNSFLEAYGKLDVRQGNISIYTEAVAKDGKISGYTKPIIKDLRVVNWEKDKGKPAKLAWEAVVGAVAWIFKNHGKDQLATKAEFEGKIKDPNVSIWIIIGEVLHNAFIQALYPALENTVNINSVDSKNKPETNLKKQYDQSKNSKSDKKK